MNKLIRAFSDQIFVTGFVHCDPHPGNVFVRPHPENKNKWLNATSADINQYLHDRLTGVL